MSDTWSWSYENASGTPVDAGDAAAEGPFPTQGEAEAWLGECWQDLADAGVEQVTLRHGDLVVYGPMSLAPG